MATERVQQDGFISKDRRISDSNAPTGKPQHDGHYTAPPQSNTTPQHHHHHHHHAKQTTFDVSRAEFEQFQQQVSYNYDCIQEHKQAMARFDQALHYFQQDVGRALSDLREDIRARGPPKTESGTAPSAGGKFDPRDIDMLVGRIASVTTKVGEIENVKMQLELMQGKLKRLEESSQSLLPPRPSTANSHREHSHHERPPSQPPQGPVSHHGPTHTLPPIHTSPLPPPSSMSTWRPQASTQAVYVGRPLEADGRWQPSTNGQGPKRSFDEPLAHEHSAPASPKRPKLAPLKPRSAFGDEPTYQNADSLSYHGAHKGPPHDVSTGPSGQAPPQILATPASATATQTPYRFITATTPSEGDAWRNEDGTLTPASARGRGRGGRGRNRPRGGRGSDHEQDTAEWEQSKHSDWHIQPVPPHTHGSQPGQHQISPNGYYSSAPRSHLQPESATEYPLTPIASAVSPHDNSMLGHEGLNAGGKKTRTKPVRNSEGILIRKDGRPDMRSVSSANNLRKVHAKKEAERAELDGRTPTSARSLAPADHQGSSDDDQKSDDNLADDSRSVSPKLAGEERRIQEQEDRKVTITQQAMSSAASTPPWEEGKLPDRLHSETQADQDRVTADVEMKS